VFTARYALSPYIKQIRFVFKGLISIEYCVTPSVSPNKLYYTRFYLAARFGSVKSRIQAINKNYKNGNAVCLGKKFTFIAFIEFPPIISSKNGCARDCRQYL
jgi:hypothetical protein